MDQADRTRPLGSAAHDDLADVLRDDGLTIVLQPIVDLRDGATLGHEALLRVRRPDDSLEPPATLFALARATGHLVELELAAIGLGLDLLDQVRPDAFLSLNVSPSTVRTGRLDQLLGAAGHGAQLVIEVIESEPDADYGEVRAALALLRGTGVRVAMDDIGAGSASLHQLGELQPDVVKLDQLLTSRVDTQPAHQAIARAMVGYAEDTGAVLVAEGLERPSQVVALTDVGVLAGQGYLLGRPMPPGRAAAS